MKYIIHYKDYGKEWSSTSYSCPEPVSDEYLVVFFDLSECEDYRIEIEH